MILGGNIPKGIIRWVRMELIKKVKEEVKGQQRLGHSSDRRPHIAR